MLKTKNTSNNLGIEISGDKSDFLETLQAIESVIGSADKRPCMAASYINIVKFCDDIKKALQDERYLVNVLWPEAVFIVGVLSGFIKFESEDLSKKTFIYDVISSPKVIFDENITKIRLLQSKIIHELASIISKQSFTRILNIYGSGHTYFVDYTTQFLDLVNCEYINLSKEQRLKKLSAMVINVLSRSGQYPAVEKEVLQLAKKNSKPVISIKFDKIKYLDKLVW